MADDGHETRDNGNRTMDERREAEDAPEHVLEFVLEFGFGKLYTEAINELKLSIHLVVTAS